MKAQLTLVIPEIIIGSSICLLILVNSFFPTIRQYSGLIIGILSMISCAFISLLFLMDPITINIFNNHYRIDHLAMGLKLATYIISIIIFAGTKINKENAKSELFLIELFAILGVSLLASSNN